MNQPTSPHLIASIVLVIIEYTSVLLLRFDPKMRQAIYPLAQSELVVHVTSYLPEMQVYATFTKKGILFDETLPEHKDAPDVVIKNYSFQLLKALASNDTADVEKLQFLGNPEQVTMVKHFLTTIGLEQFVETILSKIKGSNTANQDKKANKEEKSESYKERINEQQNQINSLTAQNRELEISLKELQSKQKMQTTLTIVACLVTLIVLAVWFFQ